MTYQQRIEPGILPVKLTARDFWLLAESGAFENYTRTELIEGEIWAMNAVHQWHARTMSALNLEVGLALRALGSPLEVWSGGSVAMADDLVPEPDLAIVERRGALDGPIALSALRLAIEVSDATRETDLGRKAKLYARHGVPEYWVADREQQMLVRHAEPGADGYSQIESFPFGATVTSATLAGLTVETSSLVD
jgi:Uma2 family endonuclease